MRLYKLQKKENFWQVCRNKNMEKEDSPDNRNKKGRIKSHGNKKKVKKNINEPVSRPAGCPKTL